MAANPYGRKLIEQFEEATRAHTMKGCGHPEDIPQIEREYEVTKKALMDYIDRRPGK